MHALYRKAKDWSIAKCMSNSLTAVIIIHTAQKGAAHTARYYVVPFGFGQIELAVTGCGHTLSLSIQLNGF
jgi:hypothetical protein